MSAIIQGATETREAGSPFAAPDADIILRSTDGVNFRTYKSYLTRTLHGFDEIFRDGQLHGLGTADEVLDGLPVILLPESSAVLELFLRTLFPAELGCPRLIYNLDLISGVVKALSKYIVKNFPPSVYDALLSASATEPERVYAITCRYAQFSEISKAAATQTLHDPCRLDNLPLDAVADLSGSQYHALAEYQVECRRVASDALYLENIRGIMRMIPGLEFQAICTCEKEDEAVHLLYIPEPDEDPSWYGNTPCSIPEWLSRYLRDVSESIRNGKRIWGEVALVEDHLAAAIDASRGCPGCSQDVAKLLQFARRLVRDIDEAIAKVTLRIDAVV